MVTIACVEKDCVSGAAQIMRSGLFEYMLLVLSLLFQYYQPYTQIMRSGLFEYMLLVLSLHTLNSMDYIHILKHSLQ